MSHSLYNNAIFVGKPSDIPVGEHWAIIKFGSIFIPGDERSFTAPGHGYPEHTETTVEYLAFLKHEDFATEVKKRLEDRSHPFSAIHVSAVISLKPVYTLEEHR